MPLIVLAFFVGSGGWVVAVYLSAHGRWRKSARALLFSLGTVLAQGAAGFLAGASVETIGVMSAAVLIAVWPLYYFALDRLCLIVFRATVTRVRRRR